MKYLAYLIFNYFENTIFKPSNLYFPHSPLSKYGFLFPTKSLGQYFGVVLLNLIKYIRFRCNFGMSQTFPFYENCKGSLRFLCILKTFLQMFICFLCFPFSLFCFLFIQLLLDLFLTLPYPNFSYVLYCFVEFSHFPLLLYPCVTFLGLVALIVT